MYQTFVLGLGALLLVGTGYFIKHTDSQGVISSSLSATTSSSVAALQAAAGVYVCDNSAGCADTYVLTLSPNGEAKMVTTFDGGVEVLDEFGTWQVNGSVATITFTGSSQVLYAEPHVIISREVSATGLANLVVDTSIYDSFTYSQFRKQRTGTN